MVPSASSAAFLGLFILASAMSAGASAPPGMARLPAGEVTLPFLRDSSETRVPVPAFWLDKRAVTPSEFLDFVRRNPSYTRSRISRLFADEGYLRHWRGDLQPHPRSLNAPVTGVSWHAAKAFCADRGKRLPTTAEWERAAATREAGDTDVDGAARERAILSWYSRSTQEEPPATGSGTRHAFGIRDLHAVIWEWTSDFNAWTPSGVNKRGVSEDGLFCGGGAAGMAPNTPYATFMRWGFRGSLKADYTLGTLGFRCARDDSPTGD
ncbi:MAG: hypothetical protein K0Q91_593 [Fibrobacteria bacterium]|jgi:formylglycine-generating enzyme required for sulfatase activity|nr:hypothetical protein [Fibrobacteria bacterium]